MKSLLTALLAVLLVNANLSLAELQLPQAESKPLFTGSSFEDIQSFVTVNHIDQLADLIASLPAQMRTDFVLMRGSQSIQAATPLSPRVILTSTAGRLFLAFSGDGQSLEIMDRKTPFDGFRFERIEFSPNQAPRFFDSNLAQNSFKCNSCHAGRPLWGEYKKWKGAYAGDAESFDRKSEEFKKYKTFYSAAQSHPLYSQLIFKCDRLSSDAVFQGEIPFDNIQDRKCQRYDPDLKNSEFSPWVVRNLFFPSEVLGVRLNRENAMRLFERVRHSANYEALKYAYVSNQLGCLGAGNGHYRESREGADDAQKSRSEEKIDRLWQRLSLNFSYVSFEDQILNTIGVDIDRDINLEVLQPGEGKRLLGTDSSEGPSSMGRALYYDGSDYTYQILSFLMLQDIYSRNLEFRGLFQKFELPKVGASEVSEEADFQKYREYLEHDWSPHPQDLPASLIKNLMSNLKADDASSLCNYLVKQTDHYLREMD